MTPEQRTELEELTNAATPGPWEAGDVWLAAGLTFDDNGQDVGPKRGTHCTYCHIGEPTRVGRMDINGVMMRAHVHRDAPYDPEHRISGADDTAVAGEIFRPEDTAFIAKARTAVPALLADAKRVRGYAQQLAESDDPVFADHGRALLAVLDGGEDR